MKSLTRGLIVAGLALPGLAQAVRANAGVWLTYQHDAQHTGRSMAFLPPEELTPAWSAPTGFSVPLVVGDAVYAMRTAGGTNTPTRIASFDLASGVVNWEVMGSYLFPSAPTYAEGLIVFAAEERATGDERLFVHDAETGAFRYSVLIPDAFAAMPTVHRNPATDTLTAYIATGGVLTAVALGEMSGSVQWSMTGSFGGSSIPTIAGESVLVAGPGQFYAFHQTTGARNHFHAGSISGGGGNTVVFDEERSRLYVLEAYNSGEFNTLTAYDYTSNADIDFRWQRTGAGIRTGNGVALGPDGSVYTCDNTTIVRLDPDTGATTDSIGGQSLANGVAPLISDGYLWVFSDSQTRVHDLETLEFVTSLPGSRGSLNTAFKGAGSLVSTHFLLDYGRIVDRPGFAVFAGPPRCIADFNRNGVLNSDDFFAYLAAFFAGDPSADIDGCGSVDSNDFFTYLTLYFEGCP